MSKLCHAAVVERLLALQVRSHAASAAVVLTSTKPKKTLQEIHSYLEAAYNAHLIKEPPDDVRRLVQLSEPMVHLRNKSITFFDLTLGKRANFKNAPGTPRIHRVDGAWFDFRLALKVQAGETEMLAYAYALRIPDDPKVSQVRLDMNGPGHATSNWGLRSHVHLNVDDEGYSIPGPILSPIEALDLLLFSLTPGKKKGRASTVATPLTL